ncbi:MAG: SDR family NAD(P)-dependent oxidoreductase, partial [Pyrinomonadaceae bacterium]
MSRALVTGGAGFIGSNVVRLLGEEGYEVIALDNLATGYRQNIDRLSGVSFVEGDVRDADLVARLMNGVAVVFHLAASVGNTRSIERPVEDSEINVIGTLRVLEAARRAGVRKIVCSSSAAIFGELKHLPIREDHPAEPDSPYGVSKLAEEKQCLVYAKLYDLEAVCLRYFN